MSIASTHMGTILSLFRPNYVLSLQCFVSTIDNIHDLQNKALFQKDS